MDYKRANRAFLYMILAGIALAIGYAEAYLYLGWDMDAILNNFLSEMTALIPAMLVFFVSRDSFREVIPFKKIRVSTGLLSALYGIVLMPLATFVTMVSMLFVENHVEGMTDQLISMPMLPLLFSVGIFGPFVEEILFRGMFLSSYKKSGRIAASVLLSSLLFGIVHMNFSQFTYGVIMGIMLALLVEATGSVWPSVIAHGIFNSIEVLLMFASEGITAGSTEAITMLEANKSTLAMIGIYFVLASVCTVIAVCIVYKISQIEGKQENLGEILKKKGNGKLVSVALIIGLILAVGYMTAIEILTKLS